MIRSIWEESKNDTIAVNLSKALLTLSYNIIWQIPARTRKVSDDDMGADGKGFKELFLQLLATTGTISIVLK